MTTGTRPKARDCRLDILETKRCRDVEPKAFPCLKRGVARRRRAWTLAGGTRALFSAYHRYNESNENRTL